MLDTYGIAAAPMSVTVRDAGLLSPAVVSGATIDWQVGDVPEKGGPQRSRPEQPPSCSRPKLLSLP